LINWSFIEIVFNIFLFNFFLLTGIAFIASAGIAFASDLEYCEAPYPVAVAPNPVTSTLMQVVVVSRHGDRSPQHAVPHEHKDTRITWNCTLRVPMRSLTTIKALNYSTGLFFLYEDESTGTFGDDKLWNGNCQPGQLTLEGGQMCTRLGAGLRSIYVDKFHLLPQTLTGSDLKLIELRTTDIQRTHESLASVIEGLYPADKRPGVYIPVHKHPAQNSVLYANVYQCPRIQQLMQLNIVNNKEWRERYLKLKPVLDTINQITDAVNVSVFNDGYSSGAWPDVFHARGCHNLPLPCSKDGKTCVTSDMADKIFDFGAWAYCRIYDGDEINRLTAGPMLVDISNHFSVRITGKGPRYVHYSAHDSTLAMTLSALKIGCGFIPYASSMRFELWQTQSGYSPKYGVQIVFNNKVIRPPECSADMCTLEEFQNMVSSRLTIKDVKKECAKQ